MSQTNLQFETIFSLLIPNLKKCTILVLHILGLGFFRASEDIFPGKRNMEKLLVVRTFNSNPTIWFDNKISNLRFVVFVWETRFHFANREKSSVYVDINQSWMHIFFFFQVENLKLHGVVLFKLSWLVYNRNTAFRLTGKIFYIYIYTHFMVPRYFRKEEVMKCILKGLWTKPP